MRFKVNVLKERVKLNWNFQRGGVGSFENSLLGNKAGKSEGH